MVLNCLKLNYLTCFARKVSNECYVESRIMSKNSCRPPCFFMVAGMSQVQVLIGSVSVKLMLNDF